MNLTKLFTAPWLTRTLPTIIRITLGILLVNHGTRKVFDGVDGMIQGLTDRGWPFPVLQAYMATYVEFAGGILLVVGLFTRPAALMNIGLFTIIFFLFHGADPFAKKELALLFLVLSTYTFLAGPGKVSVDALIFKPNATPLKD